MSMRDKFLAIKTKKLVDEIKELVILGTGKEALELIDTIDQDYLMDAGIHKSRIDAWRSMCLARTGEYRKGLELADIVLETHCDDSECEEALLDAIVTKAFAFSALGQIDESLEQCKKAESNLKSTDFTSRENMARLASILSIQGLNTLHKGDLEVAIQIYSQSAILLEELGNRKGASAALHNIGSAYRVIGNLDQALEYVSRSKIISEEIGYTPNLAGAITTIGIILYQRGRLEEAAAYLDEAVTMFKDIGRNVYLARALYAAIVIAIAQGLLSKAEGFISEMQCIDKEIDNLLVNQHFRVAKALWLKASSQEFHQDAQELFEQIVNEKITYFEITFLSLLSLSDLLIEKLQTSGDEEIMRTIKNYAEMALEIATSQGSFWLRAETYCLQSQISLLEFDYENAKRLLTQAQLIADEKGLHQLARRISGEFDELLKNEETWTELTMTRAPMAERVNFAQIDERVERMAMIQEAGAPKEDLDDPIQFMLVSAHGGICLVSMEFQTSFKSDESLVSGFLSAITSFSDEVFSLPLDRIKIGDYIMLFRAIVPFLFCYVFKGESYAALKKVDRLIEALRSDNDLWHALESTVESGLVNHQATQAVEQIVSEVFEIIV
ncbi:MAG: tetratricopeptide repeat protein [Candidatus Thorarchaeota archaeon]|nr:tetratricopeptide repeat protein [Candidatus Thorarchaeota archaeon]